MTPALTPGGGAPAFTLGANGISSRKRVVHEIDRAVTLHVPDGAPGFVELRVGKPNEFPGYPDLLGETVWLDAAACRHLARLLEAKADELSGHLASDQEAVS